MKLWFDCLTFDYVRLFNTLRRGFP
uniref:Uncharacterized protein n=1 Tax=Rhizophora mucronata TaxID=61149 RepID=A0A2P2PRF2_RHIMU